MKTFPEDVHGANQRIQEWLEATKHLRIALDYFSLPDDMDELMAQHGDIMDFYELEGRASHVLVLRRGPCRGWACKDLRLVRGERTRRWRCVIGRTETVGEERDVINALIRWTEEEDD